MSRLVSAFVLAAIASAGVDATAIPRAGGSVLAEPTRRPLSITPFDILQAFGFPTGLLPHAVSNFSLAPNGDFVVNMASPCQAVVDFWGGFPIRYDAVLRGNIRTGTITRLQGVVAEASARLIWLDVVGITTDAAKADQLKFHVTWKGFNFAPDIPSGVFAGEPQCTPCGTASPC